MAAETETAASRGDRYGAHELPMAAVIQPIYGPSPLNAALQHLPLVFITDFEHSI
jgi:hypothetical protein